MTWVGAVVLAAGAGTRFKGPKQRILLPSVLERLCRAPVDEIVVVAGAHALDLPRDTVSPGVEARSVHCPDWERGPGASLRCGLAALDPEAGIAVVVLADGPDLSPEAVARVLDVWKAEDGIAAASYGGNRGHPVVLGRASWTEVPDEGLGRRPARLVPCDDLGSPGDVDTPGDLPVRFR